MSAPTWKPVDTATADFLELVGDTNHVSAAREWSDFLRCLKHCTALNNGVIEPNALRPMVRGVVAPRRIGAFVNKALRAGLVEHNGSWQTSDDRVGRNAGRPMRVLVWIGESEAAA